MVNTKRRQRLRPVSLAGALVCLVLAGGGQWVLAADSSSSVSGPQPRRSAASRTPRLARRVPRLEPPAQQAVTPPGALPRLSADDPALAPPPAPAAPIEELPPGPSESAVMNDGAALDVKPISAIVVDARPPAGELPLDVAGPALAGWGDLYDPSPLGRPWSEVGFHWVPTQYFHGPLYFQEVNLERYGLKHGCVQPAVSALHFFALVPALPYLALVDPPLERVYDLGYRRPGSPAVRVPHRYRLRPLAAAAEAALVVGLVILIP